MKKANTDVYCCDKCGKEVTENRDEFFENCIGIIDRVPGSQLDNFDAGNAEIKEMTHLTIPYIGYEVLGSHSQGMVDSMLHGSFCIGEKYKTVSKDLCKECMEQYKEEYIELMEAIHSWAEKTGLMKIKDRLSAML